jgi:hypothetical protein
MINPNFDPTWLLDMAKESEEHFKQTLALMLEAHREIAASEEQERIVTLVENELSCTCGTPFSHLLDLIKTKSYECDCYGKKCSYCKEKEN